MHQPNLAIVIVIIIILIHFNSPIFFDPQRMSDIPKASSRAANCRIPRAYSRPVIVSSSLCAIEPVELFACLEPDADRSSPQVRFKGQTWIISILPSILPCFPARFLSNGDEKPGATECINRVGEPGFPGEGVPRVNASTGLGKAGGCAKPST